MEVDQSHPFASYGLDPHTCHSCRKIGIQRAGLSQKVIWTASDVQDAANKGCALFKMCLDGASFSTDAEEPHLEVTYPWLGFGGGCFLGLLWKGNGRWLKNVDLAAAAIPGPTYNWKLYVKITDEFLQRLLLRHIQAV